MPHKFNSIRSSRCLIMNLQLAIVACQFRTVVFFFCYSTTDKSYSNFQKLFQSDRFRRLQEIQSGSLLRYSPSNPTWNVRKRELAVWNEGFSVLSGFSNFRNHGYRDKIEECVVMMGSSLGKRWPPSIAKVKAPNGKPREPSCGARKT